jgi:spore maturation protein CgeB
MPFACDPDLHRRYDVSSRWATDIIFTGKLGHDNMPRGDDRADLLRRLSKMPNARLYGTFQTPPVYGMDYLHAINGAKVGVSIGISDDERMHHSDRPVHYIACGTFTLMRHVPDSELLFEDGTHAKYFSTVDQFFDLAKWYLEHDAERERIAQAGMHRAHHEFRCETLAGHLMNLIDEGRIDAPWAEVI